MDTLKHAAGVPPEKVVKSHGSFVGRSCIECHAELPADRMKKHLAGSVPKCETCAGLAQPNIIFLGESLPREFHMGPRVVEEADLVIITGSSLSVYPFAALPGRAREGVVRVLINNEEVERSLSVVGGWKDGVVKDHSTQEARIV
jgi:NAD-dependent histone deacetylase SIR2